MLSLHRLTLKDFGPYKGEQTVDFPSDGVTIFFGANMRGKTSLLNAIRYALFGKVLTRGSRELSLHLLTNWENAAQGVYGFSVILAFSYGGSKYELTRAVRPKPGLASPTTDNDYDQVFFLRKNGNLLGPAQRDAELSRVMPEQVSRFFLFDGELLQEYEELLRDESEMGRRIADAIERILGVPVLTSARAAMSQVVEHARRAEAKAAQKDQQTQQLGAYLAEAQERQQHHGREVARLQGELEANRDRKASLENFFRATERSGALIAEKDTLSSDLETLKKQRAEKEERLKSNMSDAWRSLLSAKVRSTRTAIAREITGLDARLQKTAAAINLTEMKREAVATAHCPVCAADINTSRAATISQEIEQAVPTHAVSDEEAAHLEQLRRRLVALSEFDYPDRSATVETLATDIDALIVEAATKKDRLDEIAELLGDLNQDDYRQQRSDYEATVRAAAILEEGIKAERGLLVKAEDNIASIQKKLGKMTNASLEKERRKRETAEQLLSLFRDSVNEFRDQLRTQVEKDASDLFKLLTTEPEYQGLRINASYGLSIIHADGSDIPVRSASAEHIVALSLMGALQRNAPLSGPIIMDSPFGRMDDGHTNNVVRALPMLAEQVALLVYDSELHAPTAREELKNKLRAEYRMVRRSARHTVLEKNVEASI